MTDEQIAELEEAAQLGDLTAIGKLTERLREAEAERDGFRKDAEELKKDADKLHAALEQMEAERDSYRAAADQAVALKARVQALEEAARDIVEMIEDAGIAKRARKRLAAVLAGKGEA